MSQVEIPKEVVEQAYRQEKDANVSKRISLVLKVKYERLIASHVARDVHSHKSWTSPWPRVQHDGGVLERGREGPLSATKVFNNEKVTEEDTHKILRRKVVLHPPHGQIPSDKKGIYELVSAGIDDLLD